MAVFGAASFNDQGQISIELCELEARGNDLALEQEVQQVLQDIEGAQRRLVNAVGVADVHEQVLQSVSEAFESALAERDEHVLDPEFIVESLEAAIASKSAEASELSQRVSACREQLETGVHPDVTVLLLVKSASLLRSRPVAAFCRASVGAVSKRTRTVKKTTRPKWEQLLRLELAADNVPARVDHRSHELLTL